MTSMRSRREVDREHGPARVQAGEAGLDRKHFAALAQPVEFRDRAARRREPERVLHQVRDDLEHAVRIADRRGRRAPGDGELDPERPRLRLVARERLVRDLGQVERAAADAELRALGANP